MSVIGTALNYAGTVIGMTYHHELYEDVGAASGSHDMPDFPTDLMMNHLLCGRVCWINPDTTNRRKIHVAAAVPRRCLSTSFDGRISLEQAAAE